MYYGDVPHSTYHSGIDQSLVTFLDQPLEDAVKDSSGNTANSVRGLLACLPMKQHWMMISAKQDMYVAHLTLDDPLSANLDPGLTECLDHLERINQESPCHLARKT